MLGPIVSAGPGAPYCLAQCLACGGPLINIFQIEEWKGRGRVMRRGSADLKGSEGQWSLEHCGPGQGQDYRCEAPMSLLHAPLSVPITSLWNSCWQT